MLQDAGIKLTSVASQAYSKSARAMLAPHARIVELLCTIPRVRVRTAQVLIAECELDMTRFATVGHFASWAGMCPGNHESGGRKRSGATLHDILVAYFHIVRNEVPFRELGEDWQRKRYSPEDRARRLQKQLEALGYWVTLSEAPAAA